MAIKVTKGQNCDGTIPKNACHVENCLCGKFHAFMKKCMIWLILGATPEVYHNQISFGYIRFVCAYQHRINTMRKQATDTDIHKHLFKGTRTLVIS